VSSTIFVVEDEADIASVLVDYLRVAGFTGVAFADGEQALQAAVRQSPALVLLDVMLPGRDGHSVLGELRASSDIPVVMLTARVEEADRLIGLELGADDYICKPFSPREVVARVKAVLRRSRGTAPSAAPGLVMEPEHWRATLDGTPLELTRKEFGVLATLAARPGRIFSRAQLLDAVYADALDTSERALDSHVKNLRRKLAEVDGLHEWIRSVYGVGFCFEPR